MAIKKNIKKEKAPEGGIVINQIIIRNIDRTVKGIADWRHAQITAESVIYANRTRLYDLYSDVRLDGHLTGVWQKRMDDVLNKQLHFQIDGKRDDIMQDLIDSEIFRKMISILMEKKAWGVSGMEFIPGEEFFFQEIPRKHIKPEIKIIAFEQNSLEGIAYEGVQNLWILGEKFDLGFLLKCSPYVLYKKGNVADWAQFIEIFGQPARIMKYDAYDTKTKAELQDVLDNSGSSLAMMIPKQADFEMLDGKQTNGDGKLQDSFKTAMDNEISVIVLGNTETSTSSASSGYAQAKVHSKQQENITKSDIKEIANQLNSNQFLSILQSYGFQVENGKFVFEEEIDLDELMNRVTVDTFVSTKVPIGDDYYYDTYGIPKPDNYVALKTKMEEDRQATLTAAMQPPAPTPGASKLSESPNPPNPSNPSKSNLSDNSIPKWKQLISFFANAHED